ncbi:MAG: 50S ribosomal protein L15 [Erysipelotrichaceae bacterium]|nr:50S ribosomal protein L15 [Erysipelotrichaceae bacterium]
MKLHELTYTEGARFTKKRLGRGQGSGTGKTSGKGHKGQNARSGGGVRLGFEGGQTPLARRLPKRGFTNFTRVEYTIVNVEALNGFDAETVVTPELLVEMGLVKQVANGGVKVLGGGELTKALTVKANKFSESAVKAIENAGGKAEVI